MADTQVVPVESESTAVAAPAPAPAGMQPVNTASLVQSILEVAKDPSIDINKVERLMAMRDQLVKEDRAIAYSAAMAAAQSEMGPVVRDKYNAQTKSMYARLESVNKVIMPIVTKHGFSLSFGTDESPLEDHYRITARCSHAAGHTESYQVDMPRDIAGIRGEINKTPTHAFGSSMTYGRRYLTSLIFNVSTHEKDDDGNAADRNQMEVKPPPAKLVTAFHKCATQAALAKLWNSLNKEERKQCLQLRKEQEATIKQADADAAKG